MSNLVRFSSPDSRELLAERLQRRFGGRVTSITPADHRLFRDRARLSVKTSYGNCFYYFCQAANGVGTHRLGYKYFDGEVLCSIGIFDRSSLGGGLHFHIVNPLGLKSVDSLCDLASVMHELTGTPVFIKKLADHEKELMLTRTGFAVASQYPWHIQAMEEDDTFPEQIVSVEELLNTVDGAERCDIRDKYQRFMARWQSEISDEPLEQSNQFLAHELVSRFFKYLEIRELHISQPTDYDNIISCPPLGKNGRGYLSGIVRLADMPAAFYAMAPINSSQMGLYANITLHQDYPYLSEFLVVHCARLLRNRGYTQLNLGGSETPGLFQFKEKFRPRYHQKLHWVVYGLQ